MIFVDTSGWLALADAHDRNHSSARALARRIAAGEFGKQVTTNYVLNEAITLIRRQLGLATALSFSKGIEGSRAVELVWIEPVHHREGLELMSVHADESWSVTDCTSFVVMRALDIAKAFTYDSDFSQAGFTIVT